MHASSSAPVHEGYSMTLLELITLLRKHIKFVVALPLICVFVTAVVSLFLLRDTYTASTSMYVLAPTNEQSNSQLSSDLSASQMLANDTVTLLKSDRVKDDAAASLGLADLSDYDISVNSETTTRVITLSVTGSDPRGVANVANAMASTVSNVAQQVMDVQSVNVIDEASVPVNPSGPNRPLYVVVAALAGLFVAVAAVVVMDMMDTRVRSAEQVEELLGLPVVGRVPEFKKVN